MLFDANKLDISDEFRRSIEAIHGYEDKVRIILNKADQVDHQVTADSDIMDVNSNFSMGLQQKIILILRGGKDF